MLSLPLASRSSRLLGQILDGVWEEADNRRRHSLFIQPLTRRDSLHGRPGLVALLLSLFADRFRVGKLWKRWLGTYVIDSKTGASCTFGQSFVRTLLLHSWTN
jgi:hypothetical protein